MYDNPAGKRGLKQRLEGGLNGIVYLVQKDVFYSKVFYAAAVVQGLNVMASAFNEQFAWSDRVIGGSGMRAAMRAASLDMLQFGEELYLVMFGLVMALVLATTGLVAYMGHALGTGNVPPLRVSRLLQRLVSLEVAFQGPITGVLLSMCECGSGFDGSDAQSWRRDCTTSATGAATFSIGLLGLVTFVLFVLLFSRMHSYNPKSFDSSARPVTWIDTLYSAIQVSVTIAFRLEHTHRVALAVYYVAANGTMAALVHGLAPFYKRPMNSLRASIHAACTWTGVCLLAVAAVNDAEDDIVSTVFLTGILPVAVLAYRASSARVSALVRQGRRRASLLRRRELAADKAAAALETGRASGRAVFPRGRRGACHIRSQTGGSGDSDDDTALTALSGALSNGSLDADHHHAGAGRNGAGSGNNDDGGLDGDSFEDLSAGAADQHGGGRRRRRRRDDEEEEARQPLVPVMALDHLTEHVDSLSEESILETISDSFGAYLTEVRTRFLLAHDGHPSPAAVEAADLLYREGLARFPRSEYLLMRYVEFLLVFKDDTTLANLLVGRCAGVAWESSETRFDVLRFGKELNRIRHDSEGASGRRGRAMDVITHEEVLKALSHTRRDHAISKRCIDQTFHLLQTGEASVPRLTKLVERQYEVQERALSRFEFLLAHVPNNRQVAMGFASFVEDVMLDPAAAQELREDLENTADGRSTARSRSVGRASNAGTGASATTGGGGGANQTRVDKIREIRKLRQRQLRKHTMKMRLVTLLLAMAVISVVVVYVLLFDRYEENLFNLNDAGVRRAAPVQIAYLARSMHLAALAGSVEGYMGAMGGLLYFAAIQRDLHNNLVLKYPHHMQDEFYFSPSVPYREATSDVARPFRDVTLTGQDAVIRHVQDAQAVARMPMAELAAFNVSDPASAPAFFQTIHNAAPLFRYLDSSAFLYQSEAEGLGSELFVGILVAGCIAAVIELVIVMVIYRPAVKEEFSSVQRSIQPVLHIAEDSVETVIQARSGRGLAAAFPGGGGVADSSVGGSHAGSVRGSVGGHSRRMSQLGRGRWRSSVVSARTGSRGGPDFQQQRRPSVELVVQRPGALERLPSPTSAAADQGQVVSLFSGVDAASSGDHTEAMKAAMAGGDGAAREAAAAVSFAGSSAAGSDGDGDEEEAKEAADTPSPASPTASNLSRPGRRGTASTARSSGGRLPAIDHLLSVPGRPSSACSSPPGSPTSVRFSGSFDDKAGGDAAGKKHLPDALAAAAAKKRGSTTAAATGTAAAAAAATAAANDQLAASKSNASRQMRVTLVYVLSLLCIVGSLVAMTTFAAVSVKNTMTTAVDLNNAGRARELAERTALFARELVLGPYVPGTLRGGLLEEFATTEIVRCHTKTASNTLTTVHLTLLSGGDTWTKGAPAETGWDAVTFDTECSALTPNRRHWDDSIGMPGVRGRAANIDRVLYRNTCLSDIEWKDGGMALANMDRAKGYLSLFDPQNCRFFNEGDVVVQQGLHSLMMSVAGHFRALADTPEASLTPAHPSYVFTDRYVMQGSEFGYGALRLILELHADTQEQLVRNRLIVILLVTAAAFVVVVQHVALSSQLGGIIAQNIGMKMTVERLLKYTEYCDRRAAAASGESFDLYDSDDDDM